MFADKARAKGVGARGALEPLLVAKLWLAARAGDDSRCRCLALWCRRAPKGVVREDRKAENEESDRSKLANNLEPRIPLRLPPLPSRRRWRRWPPRSPSRAFAWHGARRESAQQWLIVASTLTRRAALECWSRAVCDNPRCAKTVTDHPVGGRLLVFVLVLGSSRRRIVFRLLRLQILVFVRCNELTD